MTRSSKRPVLVSEVMTSHVHTASPDFSLEEIWQLLINERCHHVPIVENDRPVGMISTRDLVRIARKHGARKFSAELHPKETAGDIMSIDLETIHISEPVDVAIDQIGRGEIHALLVLDDEGRLAGIVTNHDLLHYLVD